jgi:hypothetical protein
MSAFEDASSEAGRLPASQQGRHPIRDFIELIIGYGLIVAVIWTPRPLQRWLYFGAIAWFLFAMVISFPGWRAMGFSVVGFWRSLWVVGLAVALGVAATMLASGLHTLHHPGSPVQWVKAFAGYTVWALTQQFLLQGYFLIRLLRIMPSKTWAVITAGTVFALAHLPNPILTLAITIPATVHHNMRVGLGYLTYSPPRHIHLSQIDQRLSTQEWVRAEAPTRRWSRQARP